MKKLKILFVIILFGCSDNSVLLSPDKEYFYGEWTKNLMVNQYNYKFIEDTTNIYDLVIWDGRVEFSGDFSIYLMNKWSLGRIDGKPTIIIQAIPFKYLPIEKFYDEYFITPDGIFWRIPGK